MNNTYHIKEINWFYHHTLSERIVFDEMGHSHRDRELKFVIMGELQVTYDNVVITLHPGELMLYEPDVFHNEKTLTDICEFVVIHFYCPEMPVVGRPKIVKLTGNNLVLMNLIASDRSICIDGTGYVDSEKALSTTAKLMEVLFYRIDNIDYIPHFNSGKKSFTYNQAINYMKENIGKELTIDEIARKCGVCPTVLKQIFSEYTGHGVSKHFLVMRLELAKQKLLQNVSVSEISDSIGFSPKPIFPSASSVSADAHPANSERKTNKELSKTLEIRLFDFL